MVSFLQISQVLSSLKAGFPIASSTSLAIGTDPDLMTHFPTSFPSIISLLLSFSALREWLKILVFGMVLEWCRRWGMDLYNKIYCSFFITAQFRQEDYVSYDWMNKWLEAHPSWKKAHEVDVRVPNGMESSETFVEGEGDNGSNLVAYGSGSKLMYRPAGNSSYSLWYKRRWLHVSRNDVTDSNGVRTSETLTIRILVWERKFLDRLLIDAKKAAKEANGVIVCVYIVQSGSQPWWRHVACRPKRPMSSVVLDPGVKESLLEDARDFLANKKWYEKRGIPFRRGYLLHGAPGSGKTSLIHGLSGELGLNVFILSLSTIGLDDTKLLELVSSLPTNCILLMEDIDAAFTQTLNRDTNADKNHSSDSSEDKSTSSDIVPPPAPPPLLTSKVTLSGLLNALDGVCAPEGRILFATTNKYSVLDKALTRPGRLDVHIEFGLASKYQAREIYRCFYMPESVAGKVEATDASEKGGQVAEDCEDAMAPAETENADLHAENTSKTSTMGEFHRRGHDAAQLSRAQVTLLAEKFAENIPERAVSMAALQGYLMRYKLRPREAILYAAAWVEKERTKVK